MHSRCLCLNDIVCRAVVRVPRCFCVSMVLTGVDNSSNDCGGRGGSTDAGAGWRQSKSCLAGCVTASVFVHHLSTRC